MGNSKKSWKLMEDSVPMTKDDPGVFQTLWKSLILALIKIDLFEYNQPEVSLYIDIWELFFPL